MENLIFSLNATMPIFLMMVLGYALHQIGWLDTDFASKLNKFVFLIPLPVNLFVQVSALGIREAWDTRFVVFCFVATLLSVLIAVIDSLPFFGSGFILWPGAIYFFTRGNTFLSVGYLALYGIIQITRQILQPKILGTQIGLHPLLTLFSMYFGFKCIGVFGLILGPIVAVVLKALFHARKQNRELQKPL